MIDDTWMNGGAEGDKLQGPGIVGLVARHLQRKKMIINITN